MVWVVSLGLLLLLLQGYQWLHNLHFGLPVSLLVGMGLALLSNSGLTWPQLPRLSAAEMSPQVLSATLEPPRQLTAAETPGVDFGSAAANPSAEVSGVSDPVSRPLTPAEQPEQP